MHGSHHVPMFGRDDTSQSLLKIDQWLRPLILISVRSFDDVCLLGVLWSIMDSGLPWMAAALTRPAETTTCPEDCVLGHTGHLKTVRGDCDCASNDFGGETRRGR